MWIHNVVTTLRLTVGRDKGNPGLEGIERAIHDSKVSLSKQDRMGSSKTRFMTLMTQNPLSRQPQLSCDCL